VDRHLNMKRLFFAENILLSSVLVGTEGLEGL